MEKIGQRWVGWLTKSLWLNGFGQAGPLALPLQPFSVWDFSDGYRGNDAGYNPRGFTNLNSGASWLNSSASADAHFRQCIYNQFCVALVATQSPGKTR
jgi:hypothetical protein